MSMGIRVEKPCNVDGGDWFSVSLPFSPCMLMKGILRTEEASVTFQQPLCPQVQNIIHKSTLGCLVLGFVS